MKRKPVPSADALRAHYESGLSHYAIADMYGVHQATIWRRFKQFGLTSQPPGRTHRPWQQRFWKHVTKDGPNGCWVWGDSRTEFGYGLLVKERSSKTYRGKQKTAHRLSWELHHGEVPDGLSVLHRCDNPPCVNPDHLFLGTHADNMRDMFEKGRNRIGIKGTTTQLSK